MSRNEFDSKFSFKFETPKPERLRFFIDKSGIDAELEYRCSLIGSSSCEIQSQLIVRGGLLSKMIPISAHEESVRISEMQGREFVRRTTFRTGQIKEQQQTWREHDLLSTAEAPWVFESVWRHLADTNSKDTQFRFYDGRQPSIATLTLSSSSQDRRSGSGKLIIEGKNSYGLDMQFKEWRLREISFQIPILGSLRLVRRDG